MKIPEAIKKIIEKLHLTWIAVKVKDLLSGVFFYLTKRKLFEVDQMAYWSTRAKKDAQSEDDEYYTRLNGEILKKISSLDNIRSILEIGSYLGKRTELLKSNFPDAKITASDIGTEQMKKCVMRFKDLKNLNFILCSASHLPFKGNSFDMVFSTTCFQHIPSSQIQKIVEEVERVTKNHILLVEAYIKHIPADKKFQYLNTSYYYMHDYESLLDNRRLEKKDIKGIRGNDNWSRYTLFHYIKKPL